MGNNYSRQDQIELLHEVAATLVVAGNVSNMDAIKTTVFEFVASMRQQLGSDVFGSVSVTDMFVGAAVSQVSVMAAGLVGLGFEPHDVVDALERVVRAAAYQAYQPTPWIVDEPSSDSNSGSEQETPPHLRVEQI